MERFGVTIWLNSLVSGYDGHTVTLQDGRTLKTRTLIWAAGVMGNVPPGIPKENVVRGARIAVDPFHRVKGLEDVYAIGDIAYMETPEFRRGTATG